jgi:hypothetical protein
MSKLYHLESMSLEELEREFDRLDQERRLRAVARRQGHRLAGTAGKLGQADIDPDHCDLWSPRRAAR